MKVFVSYGRDLESIVKIIIQDLQELQYDVWVDVSDIRSGDDWRERITSGILESDVVLALFSAYGLRDGGVCLDELAIAASCGFKRIKPVLMEPGIDDLIPSIARGIQYYDLSEYNSIRGRNEEEWYQTIREDFINYICNDNEQAEWIGILKERLRPNLHKAKYVFELKKEYIDRPWIDSIIEEWISSRSNKNIMLLSGFPGFGKSSYTLNYYHFNPYVASLSICECDEAGEEEIKQIIRTIAFQISVKIPSFGKRLLWTIDEIASDIEKMDISQLYNILIVEPLGTAIDGGHPPILVVIDGIDNLNKDGDNLLADVIASSAANLPPFINILISTRFDSTVLRYFEGMRSIVLNPGDKNVTDDINRFFERNLPHSNGAEGDRHEEIKQLSEKCNGSFLQAHLISSEFQNGTISYKDIERIPKSLNSYYFRIMHRIIPNEDAFIQDYYDAFAVLAAIEDAIPEEQFRCVLEWKKSDLRRFARKFTVVLLQEEDADGEPLIALFHHSFKEWISNDSGVADIYSVDFEDGLELICDWYVRENEGGSISSISERLSMLKYLQRAGRRKDLQTLANDERFARQLVEDIESVKGCRDDSLIALELVADYRTICLEFTNNEVIRNVITEAEIPYHIAESSFYYGNLYNTERELNAALGSIKRHLDANKTMNSLYMLGTACDWSGKRDLSIDYFSELKTRADQAGNDEFRIKALVGLLWNDHFTNFENSLKNCERLKRIPTNSSELSLMKKLIHARVLLSAGRLKESIELYHDAAESIETDIWGYDSVAIRNQMLLLEALVAFFDNEMYVDGIRFGEKIYRKIKEHKNISECYCSSWIALNCIKIGDYKKAERFVCVSEQISNGARKNKSKWIEMHLRSIRALLDAELGFYDKSKEGYLLVAEMAKDCSDDWVLGDACYEYLVVDLLDGKSDTTETGPNSTTESLIETLNKTAVRSGLPHLVFKNRLMRMLKGVEHTDDTFIEESLELDLPSTDMMLAMYMMWKHLVPREHPLSQRLSRKMLDWIDLIITINTNDGGDNIQNLFMQKSTVRKIMEECKIELYN